MFFFAIEFYFCLKTKDNQMNNLPLCVVSHIFSFLDFITKIHFRQTCKRNYRLKILKIPVFSDKTEQVIVNDSFLQQSAFTDLRKLTLFHCSLSSNALSHLTRLEKLVLLGDINIEDSLKHLNLKNLKFYRKNNIKDIKHMTNLKKLKLYQNEVLSDEDVADLVNLEEFTVPNANITEIKQMKKLRSLFCEPDSIITDDQISHMDLIHLKVSSEMHKVSHFTNLTYLNLRYNDEIQNDEILKLPIVILVCNRYTKNLPPTVKELYLCDNQLITDDDIKNLNLNLLECDGDNNITNAVLSNFNLGYLSINDNPVLNNIQHMTNLKELYCSGDSCITYNDIVNMDLTILIYEENPNFDNICIDCGGDINEDGIHVEDIDEYEDDEEDDEDEDEDEDDEAVVDLDFVI